MWQRSLVAFLHTQGISYTYWAWNPDSGDTGGILQDDWTTINPSKLDVLSTYQWSLLGQPQSRAKDHSENAGPIPNAYRWPGSK